MTNILNKIWNEDCVGEWVGMNRIVDKSVDMILCDLPYGTTACKWDTIIPFDKLWNHYERIIKDDGAIVLTAGQPFTSLAIVSNLNLFKYQWVWKKNSPAGFVNAKLKPMNIHEDVLVYSKGKTSNGNKSNMKYYPQGLIPYGKVTKSGNKQGKENTYWRPSLKSAHGGYLQEFTNYPTTVIEFSKDSPSIHPTQKPVALFEYLIKTYTNEGDLVLDNCAGSFTTAIACENTGRNWICMEQDREYCKMGWNRIQENRIRLQENTPQLT